MIPAFVSQLLNNHIGSVLFCVFDENGKITLKSGTLDIALTDKIILKSENDSSKIELPFFKGEELILLHIYNSNSIDLLRGKKPYALEEKIRVKELKTQIMKNIKTSLTKEVSVIYKVENRIVMNKGLFANMGIMGVVIKPAPFYNTEQTVNYRSIFHIYDSDCIDLLFVKIQ